MGVLLGIINVLKLDAKIQTRIYLLKHTHTYTYTLPLTHRQLSIYIHVRKQSDNYEGINKFHNKLWASGAGRDGFTCPMGTPQRYTIFGNLKE